MVVVLVPWCTLKVANDMNLCLGGMKRKYALDRLAILEIWPIKTETNFTIDEIKCLKETGFVLN
jgi:hypothetical protein